MNRLPDLDLNPAAWRRLLEFAHGKGPDPDEVPAASPYRRLAAERGRFVVAQVGQSLDGRIATPAGDARDVSGPGGLIHLHRLRALVDAVVIGVGTAVADDPSLTVRLVEGASPVRVVLDPNGRLPPSARLLNDGGPEVIVLGDGQWLSPKAILAELAARGLNRVLVEGGATTIAGFIEAGLVDRLHVTVSPMLIGSGPAGVRLPPVERLAEARRLDWSVHDLGSDVLFDCALT